VYRPYDDGREHQVTLLRMAGLVGLLICLLIVSALMRADRLEGWKLGVTVAGLGLWLITLLCIFLNF
jgi:hypothetical protein